MSNIITAGIAIDTSQTKVAIADLDKMAASAAKTEKATNDLTKATRAAEAPTRQVAAVFKEHAAATEAVSKAQTVSAAATNTVAANVTKAGGAATKATTSFNSLAAGQKLSAYQTQQLSYQLNDLFVQIASGGSPLTALIQQGSQLNGTFGGFGGTLRAVGTLFTGARVAIGGVVAAVAAAGAAFLGGRQESQDFAKSIALAGNAAGVTEGQFNSMAKTIADATNTTIGSTRTTLQSLIDSGRFTGEALASAGQAVQGYAKVTGQSTDDVAKMFAKAGGNVADFARATNEQYHYLTASQVDYIRTLEEQGNNQRALQITFDALNTRIASASTNLGTLERGWNAVKVAASSAIDKMLEIGRVPTPESAADDLRKQLAYINQFGGTDGRKQELRDQIAGYEEIQKLQRQGATIAAEAAAREQAKTAFMQLQDRTLSKAEIRAKEIAKANALADKAGASAEERAKVIANIQEKYKDPKGPKLPDTTRVDARALLQYRIEDIKSAAAVEVDTIANNQRVLEAQRAAALATDAEYYAAKRTMAQQSAAEQIKGLQAENALLEKQKLNTKDGLDRDREVLKNKAEIAAIERRTATDLSVLSIQQAAEAKRIADGYDRAREAAEGLLDTISRSYQRELVGVGQGDKAREQLNAVGAIEDRFRQSIQQYQGELRRKEIDKTTFDQYVAVAQDAYQREIALYKTRTDRIEEMSKSWIAGASEALNNYADKAGEVAKNTEETVGNAFKGLEDQFTNLFTGKGFDAKALGETIASDIARSFTRENITGPLSQSIANALRGGTREDLLGDFLKGKGLIGGASEASGNAAVAASAGTASAALGLLATAATTTAAALTGGSIGNALNVANLFGSNGGDSLGALISLMGWADGGPTIPGGKYQVAGFVHAGENVWSQKNIADAGGMANVEWWRQNSGLLGRLGRRGFADGGPVMPLPPSASAAVAGSGRRSSFVFSPVTEIKVDSRADQAAVRLEVQRIVQNNNEQYTRELQRLGVIP